MATTKKAAEKSDAKKEKLSAKPAAATSAKLKEVESKVQKKVPPKMKKMVVKAAPAPQEEELYENNAKDFAFAFAESMKRECEAVAAEKSAAAALNTVKLSKRPTSRAKGSDTLKFSEADLAQFRKSLIALRQSIVGKTATLKTNALEQTIDRAGEDEDGSDSFMRLQNLGQVGEQNKTLQKIEEALHSIEDGTYGICEMCGQLIRKARLQHLPFAHTCMECQSEMEANRGSQV
jgi:RNA polymerase-binding protein DksA